MSISAIGVGAGLEAVHHHHHRGQSATDASNQTSDTGQSGQTQSRSASGDTVNQAQNALYAFAKRPFVRDKFGGRRGYLSWPAG